MNTRNNVDTGAYLETPVQQILVVDDVNENLLALSSVLERPERKLLLARSGQEALDILLRDTDICLVLLDVQMAGMDGFEVAQLMQARAVTRKIPIIFMTAYYRDEAALLRGYRNGAIDYLYKPINPGVLNSKVEVFLELHRQRRSLESAYHLLNEHKIYYQSILEAVGDGILGIDSAGIIQFSNQAALTALGRCAAELNGLPIVDLCDPTERSRRTRGYIEQSLRRGASVRLDEGMFLRGNGEAFPISYCCTPVSEVFRGIVLVFQDISERRSLERQLLAQAMTDPLTGLANRNSLKQALDASLGRVHRSGSKAALMLIDIDHFKDINDTYGHEIGDRFLVEIGKRLKECVRINDTVGRLGGDEFTIILDEIHDDSDAAIIAEKILEVINQPLMLDQMLLLVGASIGIAVFPECGTDAVELMRSSDIAMYRAKSEGRNGYQFFTEDMNAKVKVRMLLEQSLRQALENRQMLLHFQPIVALESRQIVGLEALLRWQHPESGLIPPDIFIPLLEECGLMMPVGNWVVEQCCGYIRSWREAGLCEDAFTLSINVSQRQFSHPQFAGQIVSSMSAAGIPGQHLDLELTESLLMRDTNIAREVISALKQQGIGFSIDDFGTGYSSLSYLKHFPIDRLKIDKSFVKSIDENPQDLAICRTIITLAHSLNLKVVAEGIETEAQLHRLLELGCDYGQGYYFARPMPLEQTEQCLRERPRG